MMDFSLIAKIISVCNVMVVRLAKNQLMIAQVVQQESFWREVNVEIHAKTLRSTQKLAQTNAKNVLHLVNIVSVMETRIVQNVMMDFS